MTASETAAVPVAGPCVEVDSRATVLQLIRDVAARSPEAVALRSGDDSVRYRDLVGDVDLQAARLRHHGVAPGDRVAVLLPRTPDLVVALLATLAVGAAYVPLDPRFPADRIDHMLGHSDPRIILTTAENADGLSGGRRDSVLLVGAGASAESEGPAATTAPGIAAPGSVAYVIYTSGSTGVPKGVAVSTGAMANLVCDMSTRFGFGPHTVMLAVTTISFDIAVLEVFSPLIAGGTVVLADNTEIQDPQALAARIRETGANVMQATPALWSGLLTLGPDLDLGGVDVLVGGEPLPESIAAELTEAARGVWNMYGPTETTVWSTVAPVESGADITIGEPISNTRAHVLDRSLQPVPVGAIGELYLAGDGVAQGYVDQPDVTASRFVADPHRSGQRMYRTGDLARWRPDGRLDCLGRTDDQVKVRGFRIELGDVESAVVEVTGADRAVARVIPTATGGHLVAYLRSVAGKELDQGQIRDELRRVLPEYMIPAAVLEVPEFPLTPNGKIDRKALPAPDFSAMVTDSRPPTSEAETTLCDIFAQVLGLDHVGVDDDFFGLGGDSIAAVRVVGAAARNGWAVTAAHVFDARTVAAMADIAEPMTGSGGGAAVAQQVTRDRVLPETALVSGLSQDELDEFEGEGFLL